MTESALEKARREAHEALAWLAAGLTVWIDGSTDPPFRDVVLNMLRQGESAIDRLVAAAQEEAGREESEQPFQSIQDMVAAARLAGRLEQADICHKMASMEHAGDRAVLALGRERDRLRREADKSKGGGA